MKNWKKILPRRWCNTNITWRYFMPKSYCWSFWSDLKCLFRPRQRWVKRAIPYYRWSDKTHLIPEFLFAAIIHFVEEEAAFERIDWGWGKDWNVERMAARKELGDAYEYAKTGRPNLQELENDALLSGDWEKSNKLEQKLYEQDRKHMQIIVKHVEYLWV